MHNHSRINRKKKEKKKKQDTNRRRIQTQHLKNKDTQNQPTIPPKQVMRPNYTCRRPT